MMQILRERARPSCRERRANTEIQSCIILGFNITWDEWVADCAQCEELHPSSLTPLWWISHYWPPFWCSFRCWNYSRIHSPVNEGGNKQNMQYFWNLLHWFGGIWGLRGSKSSTAGYSPQHVSCSIGFRLYLWNSLIYTKCWFIRIVDNNIFYKTIRLSLSVTKLRLSRNEDL